MDPQAPSNSPRHRTEANTPGQVSSALCHILFLVSSERLPGMTTANATIFKLEYVSHIFQGLGNPAQDGQGPWVGNQDLAACLFADLGLAVMTRDSV